MRTRSTCLMFFVVVAAALGIATTVEGKPGRSEPSSEPLPRSEAIDACVELREQAYACREKFIDSMIELRASHDIAPLLPEIRQQRRKQGLKELERDGSGPLEPRRQRCSEAVSQAHDPDDLGPRRRHIDDLRICYKEADCGRRVACMMPILESFMFRPTKTSTKAAPPEAAPPSTNKTVAKKAKKADKP